MRRNTLYIYLHFAAHTLCVLLFSALAQQPVLGDSFADFVGMESIITASVVVSSVAGALLGRFLYHTVADTVSTGHAQEIRFSSRDVARLNPEGVRLEFGPFLIIVIPILPLIVMHSVMGFTPIDLSIIRINSMGLLCAGAAVINCGRVPTVLIDISDDGLWRWRTLLSGAKGATLSFTHALGFGSGSCVVRLHDARGSVIKARRLDLSFRDRDAILAMTKRSRSGEP